MSNLINYNQIFLMPMVIKYVLYKDHKKLSCSYSMNTDASGENIQPLETVLYKDLQWYRHSGTEANLIKIYIDNELYMEYKL